MFTRTARVNRDLNREHFLQYCTCIVYMIVGGQGGDQAPKFPPDYATAVSSVGLNVVL